MINCNKEVQNMSKFKIKPQSACKRFKGKKLGKDEYWSPNLFKGNNPYEYGKKIETMDMETGFIEEEFQDDEEEFQDKDD
jgi:hypothetical protein